jgi:hypothetical protein
MCRWLAYSGRPLYLEDFLFKPENSLINQSLHARKGHVATNGDGFGVGWYGEHSTPGIFRDILPAWNDANLRSLAEQISARLFFAHVRASTGTARALGARAAGGAAPGRLGAGVDCTGAAVAYASGQRPAARNARRRCPASCDSTPSRAPSSAATSSASRSSIARAACASPISAMFSRALPRASVSASVRETECAASR